MTGARGGAGRAPGAAAVDEETFLSIMSAFPSGVTVVTTLDERDRPAGLTCSATCSVSKEPPMLLVCLHRRSRLLRAISRRGAFVVNFLRDGRERVSSVFAAARDDRFAAVRWRRTPLGGLPWLPDDTIAYAECRVARAIEVGDHTVLIGLIADGRAEERPRGPLLYWRRAYGRWPIDGDAGVDALTLAAEG